MRPREFERWAGSLCGGARPDLPARADPRRPDQTESLRRLGRAEPRQGLAPQAVTKLSLLLLDSTRQSGQDAMGLLVPDLKHERADTGWNSS
jgi:hypothetical protein